MHRNLIILINAIYLQIGMLVSIMSALIPDIISTYQISYSVASALPFSFYVSFTLLCIPAGIANEKYSARTLILFSFLLALVGAALFVLFPNYVISIVSLFLIGSFTAIAQVTMVPLLRRIVGEIKLAFYSTLNQLCYGVGAFLSPIIFSFLTKELTTSEKKNNLVHQLMSSIVPRNFEWIAAYWLFVITIVLMLIWILLTRFPARNYEDRQAVTRSAYRSLSRNKFIWFFFIALAAYASCEQGVAIWMTKFLEEYYSISSTDGSAVTLSSYWFLLSCGCLLGMFLIKYIGERRVLFIFTTLAIVSFAAALYGNSSSAKIGFPLVGLFESVMWPVILAIAINSVKKSHEVVTGFLYTATAGGAVGPVVVGFISDFAGLRNGLSILLLAFMIVWSVYFWSARPVITSEKR